MDIIFANPLLTLAYVLIATAAVVGLYLFFGIMNMIATRADETYEERAKRTRYDS